MLKNNNLMNNVNILFFIVHVQFWIVRCVDFYAVNNRSGFDDQREKVLNDNGFLCGFLNRPAVVVVFKLINDKGSVCAF